MHFTKMHGLGNDFVMVNGFNEELPKDLNMLAKNVCDRQLGIGADGLIVLVPAEGNATARFLIYNYDGSQAETCGNGLRCAAMFVKKEGISKDQEFTFETLGGLAKPTIIDEERCIIRVDMGEPRLEPKQIPARFDGERVVNKPMLVIEHTYYVTLVSMGNPHCVIFIDDVDHFPVTGIGPIIENHEFFPEKTNVEFIERISDDQLKMRVWERGCGETMACGTGACAATVAASLNGYIQDKARIILKYGFLDVEWAKNNHVYMTGPATLVAEGDYKL